MNTNEIIESHRLLFIYLLKKEVLFINRIKNILTNLSNALLNRDAYIRMEYLYYDCTGEEVKKILYKFSIHIESLRTSKVIRGILVEDARNMYHTLLAASKPVEVKRGNSNCYEYFVIPKWAIKILARDIERNILT